MKLYGSRYILAFMALCLPFLGVWAADYEFATDYEVDGLNTVGTDSLQEEAFLDVVK